MTDLRLFLTAAEAAPLCGVKVATVRYWGRRGWITPHGPRNHRRYDPTELITVVGRSRRVA